MFEGNTVGMDMGDKKDRVCVLSGTGFPQMVHQYR
jgi:hypothetical protein